MAETGFVVDPVPGSDEYTWALLGRDGEEVLARAPKAYPTREEAQVAIARTRIASRHGDVPTAGSDTLIGES